jgi:hypothetical protein
MARAWHRRRARSIRAGGFEVVTKGATTQASTIASMVLRSTVASQSTSLNYANSASGRAVRWPWRQVVIFVIAIALPPALLVSHFWPFGVAHYYAKDWGLMRDRSEVALINGTLSLKYRRVLGGSPVPGVRSHFVFVAGYRAMFLPVDRPIERPWTVAVRSTTTPLVGASLRQIFVVIPLWPVWAVAAFFAVRGFVRRRAEIQRSRDPAPRSS